MTLKQIAETRRLALRDLELMPQLQGLVNELVTQGVYPATGVKGKYTALQMVDMYGADWHQFAGPHHCPHCNADLCDRENGPPFKREIGLSDRAVDRVTAWKCPDCGGEWKR